MKKIIFSFSFFLFAYCMHAQESNMADQEVQQLSSKITSIANSKISKSEQEAKIAKMLKEYMAEKEATGKGKPSHSSEAMDETVITEDQVADYVALQRIAHNIINPNPEPEQPLSRGAAPRLLNLRQSFEAYCPWEEANYPHAYNAVPGFCIIKLVREFNAINDVTIPLHYKWKAIAIKDLNKD